MDRIAIVLACDENYATHAMVVMASIMAHTKARVWFHILGDSLTERTQQQIQSKAQDLGADSTVYSPSLDTMDRLYTSAHISKAAYLRLMIGDILPKTIDKAIYLDVDLVVCKDIRELWDIDINEYVLAAVSDYGILSSKKSLAEKTKAFGWKEANGYFNSGVLVINLVKWRDGGYGKRVIEASQKHSFRHHDQDALNMVVQGNWKRLTLSWNVIPPVYELKFPVLLSTKFRTEAIRANRDIGILHWAGRKKPWQYQRYEPFNGEYYKYASLDMRERKSFPIRKKLILLLKYLFI